MPRPTSGIRIGSLLSALLTAGSFAFAQVETPPEGEETTFRVNTEMVLLSLAVRDSDNLPVANLTDGNFQVFEDGQLQEVVYFEEHRSPQ